MRHDEYPPRRRSSWRPIAALALVAVLLFGCALIFSAVRSAVDPEARAAAEEARLRQSEMDSQLQPLDTALAALWRLLPLVAAGGAVYVALVTVYRRFAKDRYIEADKLIALQRAAAQRFPSGLQHLTYHDSSRRELAEPPEDAEERPALAAPVPNFGELLTAGEIGVGRQLLLGYTTAGEPLRGSWLDLYSTLCAGMSGTGKTTTQRFLAAQTALHGAKFALVDPHSGAAEDSLAATLEPLRTQFLCEPASTDKAILEVARLVADIGKRRITGKDADRTPVVLWIDEATSLLGRSSVADELAELLERVAQEYRKRGVYVCASGQIFTAARATSELRDSFASVICHRMKRAQARLLLPLEDSQTVERLSPGRAVLWRTSGASETIQIPDTRAEDIRQVAALLSGSAPAIPRLHNVPPEGSAGATLEPDWNRSGAGLEPGSTATGRGEVLSADCVRAAALFLAGKDIPAIVRELYGVDSRSGSQYQKKSAEVQALLRAALQR